MDWEKTLIHKTATVQDAIKTIDDNQMLVAFVIDEEQKLLGMVTDRDLRRGLLKRISLDAPVTEERSRAIAELGMSKGAVWERFSSLRERENLFIEKIGETDYELEKEGVAAEFGIDTELLSGAELSNLLQRRSEQRTAAFGGGGGAMVSGARTGFGAANY